MLKLVSSEEIATIDKMTISDYGLSDELLMGFAGKAVFDNLVHYLPRRPVILTGKGNNGGDGLVLAHFFANLGVKPELLLIWPAEDFSLCSKYYWDILAKTKMPFRYLKQDDSLLELLRQIALDSEEGLMLIDALFGTGLSKPLEGRFAHIARDWNIFNHPNCVKIAIDIPSGINGSGLNLGKIFLKSDKTFTMGLPKIGLFTLPGKTATGDIEVLDIGFPKELLESDSIQGHILTDQDFHSTSPFLPAAMSPDSHKYQRGVSYIIGGNSGMEGAAILAARTALIAGSGLVKLYIPKKSAKNIAGKIPEVQVRGINGEELKEELQNIIQSGHKASIAIGPGLGRDDQAREILKNFLHQVRNHPAYFSNVSVVIDADALVMLPDILYPKDFKVFNGSRQNLILTPHFGELRALFQNGIEAQKNALNAYNVNKTASIRTLAQESGFLLLAKGNDTIIAEPSGNFFINPTGNNLLARGGSGDILTGLIAGFLSQGLKPFWAAATGAYILGKASDLIRKKSGRFSGGGEALLKKISKLLKIYGTCENPLNSVSQNNKRWEIIN